MKQILLLTAVLLPLSPAYADITVKTNNFELSDDCVRLSADNVSIESDDCKSKKWDGKDKKGNASIHGDDNPGKGHNKAKKDKKY